MPDDEKRYTERDLILAKREVYADLLCAAVGWSREGAEQKATGAFPFPKRTRPRVLTEQDGRGLSFRFTGDPTNPFALFEYSVSGGREWRQTCSAESKLTVTAERVRIMADLLANPTEEVPDAD